MPAYYLDDHLSVAEGTRLFAEDGVGREIAVQGYYTAAIRRTGCSGWVFRFRDSDHDARSVLETLNHCVARRAA